MAKNHQAIMCQRCGSGFILTSSYLNLLARRGVKVVVPTLCPTCFLNQGPLPKQQGTVKWFSAHKNYGFIVADNGEEVFFHQKQILEGENDSPDKGQPVQFHVHYPIKGPEALNVEMVKE